MKFTENQRQAIEHLQGPCLVLAVPGSGKTTVLLARIKNLISKGVDPKRILAMTFSKSQALDMEKRYISLYGQEGVKFSTIHSFAYGIIRSFSPHPVNLIESSDKYNKYKLVGQIFYNKKKRTMTDEQMENFFRVSSFLKNTLMDYSDYKKMYGDIFRGFIEIYQEYERIKRDLKLIDFDDMLLEALRILQTRKEVLSFLQEKFEYIQVDEGQDTSYIQLKIISLVANRTNNLFILADDDQSIYGFRGASSKQLLDFPKVYPEAKIICMQDNFRSRSNIISMSNKLIKHNLQRYRKVIQATKDQGDLVRINKIKNLESQAKHVLSQAKEDLAIGKSVAILYRNNVSAIPLINHIEKDLDFYIKDGKMAFFMSPIIRDLIDTYNFAKDPYDIKLFERIYYKFNLYLKRDFVDQLKFLGDQSSVIDNLKEVEGLNNFYLDKIYDLSYYMDKLASLDFGKAVEYIIFNMDYYEYLRELARRNSNTMLNYDRTIDTFLQFTKGLKTVKQYEDKVEEFKTLLKDKSFNQADLTLSTIHGSKGLEFDSVYLIDLIQDEFPSSYSQSQDDDLGILEEERRLFYVGLTRAKDKLSLFYPDKVHINQVSRSSFIDQITKD